MQLTNVKVTTAKKVSEGDGEHGHWELWSLKIDGKEYSKFRGEKDLEFYSGMEIAYAEAEERVREKDGKTYKNWQITKMLLAEPPGLEEPKQEPGPLPKPKAGELPYSMKMSYVKDVACQLVSSRNIPLNEFGSHLSIIWKAIEDVTNGEEIPF